MVTRWKVDLPGSLPKGIEAAHKPGAVHVVMTVPETWCYHLRRPAPPGGWTRRLREELRSGLLPESSNELWWDEAVHSDGTWEVWAISPSRILSVLPSIRGAKGLRVRICTKEHWDARPQLSAFPNVAPPGTRPMRWPWTQIRSAARWGLPPLVAILILGGMWIRQHRELARANWEIRILRSRVDQIQGDLAQEMGVVRSLDPSASLGPVPFISDLDALTRLVPEDSHGVDLKWRRDRVELDLITPKPEVVREALEASPEFQNVHFEGNLERRGDRSRLRLSMRPEVPR